MDNLELRLGQALQLMKGRVVAQVLSRRILTVQRIQPECEINHTNPQPAALRSYVTLRYHRPHATTIEHLRKN
jgi:hypothetical protein